MRAALAVVLLLALPAIAGPAPASGAAPAWWDQTLLDLDRDRIDDALKPWTALPVPLTVLVSYDHRPTTADRRALAAAGHELVFAADHFPILVVRARGTELSRIANLPGVVLVERNDVLRPLLRESVPLIGAPQAWSGYRVEGEGQVIAILDDGAYEQHPDFDGKVAARYDAAASSTLGRDRSEPVVPAGEDGHGTHVAGAIIGTGEQAGGAYRGVAPAARFVNVKVFSAPNQTTSDIVLRGLDWVLTNRDALGIRIVQMSLGGRPSDGTDAISRSVDIAVDLGLVVIAAAGNGGPEPGTVASPGASQKAITVGAVDKRKAVAPFSSRGPTADGRVKPDLVAPGVRIVSTVPPVSTTGIGGVLSGGSTTYYGALSGTSMASPHVAGVVALMLEANPKLTPAEVRAILLATAQDLGPMGADNDTGFGFVNAAGAVQVASDPRLLKHPRFQAILATIPDSATSPWRERFVYELGRLSRDSETVHHAALVLIGTLGAAYLAVAFRRARKG